jgi:hypothetical protein
MSPATLEMINHFFRVHGKSTDWCLEPTETCSQRAIQAHSIPTGTVLNRLARDGHVVMPVMKLKMTPPVEVEFKPVGKHRASTFTGMCAQHDNGIFRPIDERLPDLNDNSHLFLLAYRAVLREFHAVLQNAILFQSTFEKRVDVGLSPGDEPCDSGMLATGHLCNAFESYEYKRQFDAAYLTRDWSQLKHYVLVLKDQSPSIAVSSMFSLDDVAAPETPRVTLSIYPAASDVAVVFSALPADAPFVEGYLSRLHSSQSHFQKYLLSKVVLQHCSNFVIDPQHFDAMPEGQVAALRKFFVGTISKNAHDHEDAQLYLF